MVLFGAIPRSSFFTIAFILSSHFALSQCQVVEDFLQVTIDPVSNTISATLELCNPCVAGESMEGCECYLDCLGSGLCAEDCEHLGVGSAYYNWCIHECCETTCDFAPMRTPSSFQFLVLLWWTTAWTIPDPPNWPANQISISPEMSGTPGTMSFPLEINWS